MPIAPPPTSSSDRRYGWYRTYEDFVGHAKWRMVATRAGVHLSFVHTIVQSMFQAASKARAEGYLGGWHPEVCAAQTDIDAKDVSAVHRVLVDIGWLNQHVIVDWADRNPRDKTATDRQRNKRMLDDARRAVASGTARPDQIEMLSVPEREALARLAQLSRVTAAAPAPPPIETVAPFVTRDEPAENERAARMWLVGDGTGLGYGPASKIVADNFGCNRLNADATIRRWLKDDMLGDVVTLATIISAAEEMSIGGDGFRNVVEQRMALVVRERTRGPALDLRMGAIKGGRA